MAEAITRIPGLWPLGLALGAFGALVLLGRKRIGALYDGIDMPEEDRERFKRVVVPLLGWVFVAFGGLAVVVAAVGLYGVIGYTVAQRMHELGMRVALGAQSGHIVRLVLKQGIGFAAGGVTIGLVLALVASRWIEPLLYKQSPRDPVVFAAVCVLMISVGAIASAVPAMRAIRADPNRVLRAD